MSFLTCKYTLTSHCCMFPALMRGSYSATYGNIVRVTVGQGERKCDFSVHKGLVCAASPYFNAALNNTNFKEGREGAVHLEEDDVEVFKSFLCWLYTRDITPHADEEGYVLGLIKLFVFADARGVRALKIALIDALFDAIAQKWTLPVNFIPYVYENTPDNSGLRKLMVDMVLRTQDSLMTYCSKLETGEFFKDYAVAQEDFEKIRPRTPRVLCRLMWCMIDRCAYHEHKEELAVYHSDTKVLAFLGRIY